MFKKERKRGESLTAHSEAEKRKKKKKSFFFAKNNVRYLLGALQQKGKKEKFLFSIIIQTCSTKTTNHIHKPLIGTVYLSENIIEPKNKKAVVLKVSFDNKQVLHLKVSSVSLWQVHSFHFKMSPFSIFLQTALRVFVFCLLTRGSTLSLLQ